MFLKSILLKQCELLESYIDYDVGTNISNYGDWCQCVVWLAKQLGQTVPAEIQSILDYATDKEKGLISEFLYRRSEQMFEFIPAKAVMVYKKKNKRLYIKYMELKNELEDKCDSAVRMEKTKSHYRHLENKIIQTYAV